MANTFCTTLWRRASFSSAIPSLATSPGLQLKGARVAMCAYWGNADTHRVASRKP